MPHAPGRPRNPEMFRDNGRPRDEALDPEGESGLKRNNQVASTWVRLMAELFNIPQQTCSHLKKSSSSFIALPWATGTSTHLVLPSRSYAETLRARSECNRYSRRAPEQSEGHQS